MDRATVFGSSDGDVDVLVEFEPGRTPGFAFVGIQEELSEVLGRKVDLNTPACLSRYFRDRVVQEAKVLYNAGKRLRMPLPHAGFQGSGEHP
ncbi:MAG: nucleotidyltransferase [Chloroflexi bacterium]|nr:nucleotidyltransferase [Chloroflexota bacterium]